MFRSLLTLALALPLLAACQLSLPGGSRDDVAAANPITGGEIAVTTLDGPAPAAAKSEATADAAAQAAVTPAAPTARPLPNPATEAEAPEPAATEPAAPAEPPPAGGTP